MDLFDLPAGQDDTFDIDKEFEKYFVWEDDESAGQTATSSDIPSNVADPLGINPSNSALPFSLDDSTQIPDPTTIDPADVTLSASSNETQTQESTFIESNVQDNVDTADDECFFIEPEPFSDADPGSPTYPFIEAIPFKELTAFQQKRLIVGYLKQDFANLIEAVTETGKIRSIINHFVDEVGDYFHKFKQKGVLDGIFNKYPDLLVFQAKRTLGNEAAILSELVEKHNKDSLLGDVFKTQPLALGSALKHVEFDETVLHQLLTINRHMVINFLSKHENMDLITKFFADHPRAAEQVFDTDPSIISRHFEQNPGALRKCLDSRPELVTDYVSTNPSMLDRLVRSCPELISKLHRKQSKSSIGSSLNTAASPPAALLKPLPSSHKSKGQSKKPSANIWTQLLNEKHLADDTNVEELINDQVPLSRPSHVSEEQGFLDDDYDDWHDLTGYVENMYQNDEQDDVEDEVNDNAHNHYLVDDNAVAQHNNEEIDDDDDDDNNDDDGGHDYNNHDDNDDDRDDLHDDDANDNDDDNDDDDDYDYLPVKVARERAPASQYKYDSSGEDNDTEDSDGGKGSEIDDEDDDDDESVVDRKVRNKKRSIKPTSTSKRSLAGQKTQASTTSPNFAPYPASEEAKVADEQKPRGAREWTLRQEDCGIKHMLDVRDEGQVKGEKRFAEAATRMNAELGGKRTSISFKNFWNRAGRQRSGFDERRCKKAPLATSLQGKQAKAKGPERKKGKNPRASTPALRGTERGEKRKSEDDDSDDAD